MELRELRVRLATNRASYGHGNPYDAAGVPHGAHPMSPRVVSHHLTHAYTGCRPDIPCAQSFEAAIVGDWSGSRQWLPSDYQICLRHVHRPHEIVTGWRDANQLERAYCCNALEAMMTWYINLLHLLLIGWSKARGCQVDVANVAGLLAHLHDDTYVLPPDAAAAELEVRWAEFRDAFIAGSHLSFVEFVTKYVGTLYVFGVPMFSLHPDMLAPGLQRARSLLAHAGSDRVLCVYGTAVIFASHTGTSIGREYAYTHVPEDCSLFGHIEDYVVSRTQSQIHKHHAFWNCARLRTFDGADDPHSVTCTAVYVLVMRMFEADEGSANQCILRTLMDINQSLAGVCSALYSNLSAVVDTALMLEAVAPSIAALRLAMPGLEACLFNYKDGASRVMYMLILLLEAWTDNQTDMQFIVLLGCMATVFGGDDDAGVECQPECKRAHSIIDEVSKLVNQAMFAIGSTELDVMQNAVYHIDGTDLDYHEIVSVVAVGTKRAWPDTESWCYRSALLRQVRQLYDTRARSTAMDYDNVDVVCRKMLNGLVAIVNNALPRANVLPDQPREYYYDVFIRMWTDSTIALY